MIDCHTGDWAREMLDTLGLSHNILGHISPPGTAIGTIRSKLAEQTGLPTHLRVVAPAAHDTASAVAAVPANSDVAAATGKTSWCYLSSGTWSLLGAEIITPCVTPDAQAASFTNELGVAGRFRFLKNIPGLWLVQECRRDFGRQGQKLDYTALTQLASAEPAFRTLVDPTHPSFQSPGDMLRKIAEFSQSAGQPAPESPGQYIRACLESLALAYRDKLVTLESILNRRFDTIHVVGGGGKNELLSQMTADATGRRVVVGPYEATATGNTLVQAMAVGDVRDLGELRRIVADSFDLVTYEPSRTADWQTAHDRFRSLADGL
jgi:rhamnulokinase